MKLLASALLAVGLALPGSAQITSLQGTGCSGNGPTLIFGQPTIGSTLNIVSDQFPCNSPRTWGFVLVSVTCQLSPNIPWSCNSNFNPCRILSPVDALTVNPISARLQLPIPNDPNLRGATFCVQGGCYTTFLPPNGLPACFSPLHEAAAIRIQ